MADGSVADRSVVDRSVVDRSVVDRSVVDRFVVDRFVVDRLGESDESGPDGSRSRLWLTEWTDAQLIVGVTGARSGCSSGSARTNGAGESSGVP